MKHIILAIMLAATGAALPLVGPSEALADCNTCG